MLMEEGSLEGSNMELYLSETTIYTLHTLWDTTIWDSELSLLLQWSWSDGPKPSSLPSWLLCSFHPSIHLPNIYEVPLCAREGLRWLTLTDTPHSQNHTHILTHTVICAHSHTGCSLSCLSCHHLSHIYVAHIGLGTTTEGSSIRVETL